MSLANMNDQPRFGLKGRAAPDWLCAQGVALPQQPNSWLELADDGRVLRLGRGEYLFEGAIARQLESAWRDGCRDLFRVPRHDAAFVLEGEPVPALLQEICTADTRPQAMLGQVLMTLGAGISVTLVCAAEEAAPRWRLWCDATYGDYMHGVLQDILG